MFVSYSLYWTINSLEGGMAPTPSLDSQGSLNRSWTGKNFDASLNKCLKVAEVNFASGISPTCLALSSSLWPLLGSGGEGCHSAHGKGKKETKDKGRESQAWAHGQVDLHFLIWKVRCENHSPSQRGCWRQ